MGKGNYDRKEALERAALLLGILENPFIAEAEWTGVTKKTSPAGNPAGHLRPMRLSSCIPSTRQRF